MSFRLEELLFMIVPPTGWFLITLIMATVEYVRHRISISLRKTTGKLVQIKSEVKSMSASPDSSWWVVKSSFVYEYIANKQTYREALDSIMSPGQTDPPTEELVKAVNQSVEESCPAWRKEIEFWYDPAFPTKLMILGRSSTISEAGDEFWWRVQLHTGFSVVLAIFMTLMIISDKLGCQTSND